MGVAQSTATMVRKEDWTLRRQQRRAGREIDRELETILEEKEKIKVATSDVAVTMAARAIKRSERSIDETSKHVDSLAVVRDRMRRTARVGEVGQAFNRLHSIATTRDVCDIVDLKQVLHEIGESEKADEKVLELTKAPVTTTVDDETALILETAPTIAETVETHTTIS